MRTATEHAVLGIRNSVSSQNRTSVRWTVRHLGELASRYYRCAGDARIRGIRGFLLMCTSPRRLITASPMYWRIAGAVRNAILTSSHIVRLRL